MNIASYHMSALLAGVFEEVREVRNVRVWTDESDFWFIRCLRCLFTYFPQSCGRYHSPAASKALSWLQ